MKMYKIIMIAACLGLYVSSAQSSSLIDQAAELPIASGTNALAFLVAGPALGAYSIKGFSLLPIGESIGFSGCFLANSLTWAALYALSKQTKIHPAWAYSPLLVFCLPSVKVGIDLARGKNPNAGCRKPVVTTTAFLLAQSALAGPVLGLAAIGLVDIVKSLKQ